MDLPDGINKSSLNLVQNYRKSPGFLRGFRGADLYQIDSKMAQS